jgi:hypothetical protein
VTPHTPELALLEKGEGRPKRKKAAGIVRLEDVAPRNALKGGKGRPFFAERLEGARERGAPHTEAPRKPPD